MKREDVIRLAKEAGIEFIGEYTPHTKGQEKWEKFAALVAAAERERCAAIAEDDDLIVLGVGYYDQRGDAQKTAQNIEKAIRALGDE